MNQRRPRLHDPGYLSWLRQRPCLVCGKNYSSDAAHIRSASIEYGKAHTGMGEKPDDKWALPLCRPCHVSQHAHGDEVGWWKKFGLNPFQQATKFYIEYGGTGGRVKRKLHIIKPRLPKEQRQKIRSRGFK